MSTGLLNSFLNPQPQNTDPAGPMHVEMLPISYIMPNPDNKKIYIVGDVERLKDDIKANGVRQPLEVIRWANGYKLIGGERRLTACKQLAAEGDERFTTVPCTIVESKGELEDKISLITANATARDLTDWERVAQYEALKDALTKKKQDGKLEGKVRDELCRILGISTGAAARLNIVATTQNETIKERLRNGEIGFMQAVKDAQDYARFMEQASEDPEPEEPPKAAPAVTIPKESDKFPLWVLVVADDVCKKSWVEDLPEFSAKCLESCWHVKHYIAENLKSGSIRCSPKGIHFGNNSGGGEIFLTWERFVSFCIDEGIAPEKHAAKSAAKSVEPAKPAADLAAQARAKPFPRDISNRELNTLIKLARKTLDDKDAWTLYLCEPEFRVEYHKQSLPGGATLWMRLDEIAKERQNTAGYADYAIILQDKSFYTDGWIGMGCIVDDLVKWFNLSND